MKKIIELAVYNDAGAEGSGENGLVEVKTPGNPAESRSDSMSRKVSSKSGKKVGEAIAGGGQKFGLAEFMQGHRDITQWMAQAHQPFLGFMSNGVWERFIKPLLVRNPPATAQMDGRVYDIAWMSSCRLDWGRTADECRAAVNAGKISEFRLKMAGRIVTLCKVYNITDFGDYVACLIMLPEEAKNYKP